MLEKSHAATRLENKKQWQQLHLHGQALEQSTINTARPTCWNIGSKATQEAIDNYEFLHQLEQPGPKVKAAEHTGSNNTLAQDVVADSDCQFNDLKVPSAVKTKLVSRLNATDTILHRNDVVLRELR